MAQVECIRCKRSAEGLAKAPLPGDVGREVAEKTCAACWKDWLGAQVILINEHGLSPGNPEDYQRLVTELRAYLGLQTSP
jgi:Fe-S cluster biosynthesis and repair protein YggX